MSETYQTAVFGLGSMGLGMAQSCLRAGLTTYGYDVRDDVARRFLAEGGAPGSADDVAPGLDAVMVVVLNAAQTRSVLFGEGDQDGKQDGGQSGIVARLRPGAVVISCATVAPDFAREMAARCVAAGVGYLDAPISGGSIKAAAGQLSIMAAGSEQSFAAARPALEATAATVFNLGESIGAGSAMKAVNQLLAGVHIATMAEALTFGMTQGITPQKFVEVIPKCAGTSWMLENRAPHIVDGDYTPRSQINIWPKDLNIVLEIAKAAGFDAPLAQTALQRYMAAVEQGLGGEDDAAVAKVYARMAGVTLPGEA